MVDSTSSLALLRRELRARRRAVSPPERLAAADAVARGVLAQLQTLEGGYVAGYWAVDGELPLHSLQLRLPEHFVYCLPVLDEASHTLRFAPFRAGDAVQPNRHGIPEPVFEAGSLLHPEDLAVVLMPLTGFDMQCHRLGMGGGWYDRSFAGLEKAPRRLGVAFDCQRVESLPLREWDIACHAIITETTTYTGRLA